MQNVVVAPPVHIDPPFQAEPILLLAALGTEVVEECLHVLLHLITELCHYRLLQFEEVEGIMPTP
jgi:hypothetical protein